MSFIKKRIGGVQGYLTLPPTDPPTTAPPTSAPTTAPPEEPISMTFIEDVGSGVYVDAAGSANTKGSWIEIGTLSNEVNGLIVEMFTTDSLGGDYLLDIGLGETPVVAIPDILMSDQTAGAQHNFTFYVPLHVEEGTKVSARVQSTSASRIVYIGVKGCVGDIPSIETVEAIGANAADSGGVVVDPGATIMTKGSWAEISSALPEEAKWIGLCLGGRDNLSRDTAYWLVDIATGGAGSEVTIIENIALSALNSTDTIHPRTFGMFPFIIAEGTRISARAMCTINDSNDRLFDVVLYIGY